MTQFNLGWWSCFISMYYESIGTKSDEVVDVIVGVAKAAKVTEKEIDTIIQFYGEDGLDEEVLGFLNRLKKII